MATDSVALGPLMVFSLWVRDRRYNTKSNDLHRGDVQVADFLSLHLVLGIQRLRDISSYSQGVPQTDRAHISAIVCDAVEKVKLRPLRMHEHAKILSVLP
jgi:hypothetical protein